MIKKILSKMNIIDAIIIISALIIIFSLTYRIVSESSGKNHSEYIVSVICSTCPDSVSNIIETNPYCFLYDTQKPFGKIISSSYTEKSQNANKLQINIQTSAKAVEHGVSVNGSQVLIGKHLNLIADNAVFSVLVESINKLNEES